jgi:Tol biopolymer transport system component
MRRRLTLLSCTIACAATILTALVEPVRVDSVPGDLMSRVVPLDDRLAYSVRREGLWMLVARTTSASESQAEVLLRVASGSVVLGPSIAPDGRRLYFESNERSPAVAGREDTDVWIVERATNGWGPPRPLGAPFDSPFNEHSPSVDTAGTLCFNSGRPDGRGENDIYCGRLGTAAEPRLVATVSSPEEDAFPWLEPSGRRLVFASNRSGGLGGWDLYVAERSGDAWSAPRNLGAPINSAHDETSPSLSRDAARLYFHRLTGEGPSRSRAVLVAPFDTSRRR